ncbi:CAP domain-containing protein [Solibacillus sp. FSL K6-4121]|uniref:CAP domain-containing protein n=1 Tax=Solibacillus sp. FSL K6-4121 TaxID=2921505 RepID=UPI0030F5989D
MSKDLIRSLAIAAVFTGGFFAVDAVQETHTAHASSTQIDGYTYSAEVVEAFNEINKHRKATGLQPYKIDPFLSKSAESHAKYLVTHVKGASHEQTSGKSGYTGKNFTERAKSAGYTIKFGSEAASYGTSINIKRDIADFIEAIFHRDTILSPIYETVGIGIVGGAFVVVTDSSDGMRKSDVSYPYNGQTEAPTLFDVTEKPDPLQKYGVKTSGYMISYTPKENLGWLGGHTMTLKDSKGVSVPLWNKNNEPDEGLNTLYIVPKAELKSGEKYTVNVTYTDIKDKVHSHSWSFTTAGKASQTPPKESSKPTTPSAPSNPDFKQYASMYADFNPNAWWASDMAWALDRGYLSGYGKELNPKTKKYEEYLKPGNQLTEAHFLMIFFRYISPDEYRATKATSNWAYSVPYQLAKKYNLPTLANESSTAKKNLASQGIKRGKLAQLMVSKDLGKTVSETDAINYMIKNKLTSAKTIKDYNATQILTRAQVSAFLKNHKRLVESQK